MASRNPLQRSVNTFLIIHMQIDEYIMNNIIIYIY